jgi:hypothetical protein
LGCACTLLSRVLLAESSRTSFSILVSLHMPYTDYLHIDHTVPLNAYKIRSTITYLPNCSAIFLLTEPLQRRFLRWSHVCIFLNLYQNLFWWNAYEFVNFLIV